MEATLPRIDSGISFRNAGRSAVRGSLLHIAPDVIVFEVYSPYPVAETGETLRNVQVLRGGKLAYDGDAIVRATLATGMTIILTATPLGQWLPVEPMTPGGELAADVRDLIRGWGNSRPLMTEYQVAISDLRSFLTDMSQWLAPLDAAGDRADDRSAGRFSSGVAHAIYAEVGPRLKELFGRYEEAFHLIPAEEASAHRAHAQRELHPLVLCAPLIHRSYIKPMGYAGDYGTVNMILENKAEGPSTYARVLNLFFTGIDICQGHRNRIDRLVDMLREEVRKPKYQHERLRVLNLGCGPVDEVCRFIQQDELSERCDFTLLDFSTETIEYAKARLEKVCQASGRRPGIEFVNQSIHDLLKEAVRNGRGGESELPRYDLAYCAGLFDYLSDRVCDRLMKLMHDWVAPGGRVVATNVHPRYATHAILEDLAEWHLILRSESEMEALAPSGSAMSVSTDPCAVNVFLDVRKSEDVDDFGRSAHRRRIARESVSGV